MKKPIESLLIILRPFLNALMLVESITCCGQLFHRSMTRSEKKKRLKSNEQWFFRTLTEWPLVLVTELSVKTSKMESETVLCTYGKLQSLWRCTCNLVSLHYLDKYYYFFWKIVLTESRAVAERKKAWLSYGLTTGTTTTTSVSHNLTAHAMSTTLRLSWFHRFPSFFISFCSPFVVETANI